MKDGHPYLVAAVNTAMRVTAHVQSRVLRRDLRQELTRLQQQPATRTYAEMGVVLAVLLGLALIAASFGWIGLAVYFGAVLVLFY